MEVHLAEKAASDEWFEGHVQVDIDQIERGEFIEEQEIDARVERMLQSEGYSLFQRHPSIASFLAETPKK